MSFPDLGSSPLRPQTSSTTSASSGGQRSPPASSGRTGSVGRSPSSPALYNSSGARRPSPSQRAQAYYARLFEQSLYEGAVLRAFQWKILHPDEPEARELFLQFRKIVSADIPYRDRDAETERREASEMWAECTRIIADEIEERERKKNVSARSLFRQLLLCASGADAKNSIFRWGRRKS